MHPRDAALLSIRILSLYLGVQAVLQLSSFVTLHAGPLTSSIRFVLPVAVQAVIAGGLWAAAETLAASVAHGAADTRHAGGVGLGKVAGLAVFVLGLYLVVSALPALIGTLLSPDFGGPFFGSVGPFGGRRAALAAAGIQALLGLGAVIWGRSVMRRRDRADLDDDAGNA